MKNNLILYILLLGFFFSSCYDDLGNYDYKEVNDVVVKMNKTYGAKKEASTFVIRPEIKQTSREDNSNLKYAWTLNTRTDQERGDTLSKGDTLAMLIDPEMDNFKYLYYGRFYVTDTITGAKQMFPFIFNISKPYEGAWTILHRQDNITKLGTVEYVGSDMLLDYDAYFKERGEHLKGMPVALGVGVTGGEVPSSYWGYEGTSIFYCFTSDATESGILNQGNKFELYADIQKIIYPEDYTHFSLSNIRVGGEDGGVLLISDGYAFQGNYYSARMYGMYPSNMITGPYKITHAADGPQTHLAFDAIGRRFLHCYTKDNYFPDWDFNIIDDAPVEMELVRKDPGNVAGVNLDDIGQDKEMVYMGEGYWYGQSIAMAKWQRYALYAFAKSKSTNQSYVYEFHSYPLTSSSDATDHPLAAFFTINTPAGVTAETPMASSFEFNRLLFYAVDNRVYRLDFGASGGNVTMIYQHPEGVKAIKMKMAREGNWLDPYEAYGHSPARSLGVVFEMKDGTNEFVVLNLNNAGKVDVDGKYPSRQVFKKFGKITDIAFI